MLLVLPFPDYRIWSLMAVNYRSNAAFGMGTVTILAITSDQQADQNPPEQLITSAVIRTWKKTGRGCLATRNMAKSLS